MIYRAPDVFAAQFVRTRGAVNGPTAYGTVTTWATPRDGAVGCDPKTKVPADADLARRLACG